MEEFNLDAFIAGINQDKTQSKSKKDKLNRVLMNTKTNQGVLQMIPVMSKQVKNFYLKIPRVYEFYGDTSILDSGEAWYRIMPVEFYEGLSEDQLELYHEVKGMLDTLNDDEEVSYDEFRVRNYALFFGICDRLKNTDGKENEDLKDCPCMFVYPSNSVIDSLGTAINNKIDAMKGKRDWIPMVLSPHNTGRQGVMIINFTKAAGPGYDTQVSFEFNSAMNMVVDPDMVIEDKTMELFDEVIPTFLGWIYDSKSKSYFNEVAFKELRDQLKLRLEAVKAQQSCEIEPADAKVTYENKNNLNADVAAPTKKTPF